MTYMMSQAYTCKHLRVHCPCVCKWMIYVPFVVLDSALRPIYRLADKKRSSQTDAKVINWHERDWSSMPQKPCHLHVNVWKRSHREPALWWHDKEIWGFFANCFMLFICFHDSTCWQTTLLHAWLNCERLLIKFSCVNMHLISKGPILHIIFCKKWAWFGIVCRIRSVRILKFVLFYLV